jgi:hypothetical protein
MYFKKVVKNCVYVIPFTTRGPGLMTEFEKKVSYGELIYISFIGHGLVLDFLLCIIWPSWSERPFMEGLISNYFKSKLSIKNCL